MSVHTAPASSRTPQRQALSPVVLQPSLSKEEINLLPLRAWEGNIALVQDEESLSAALEDMRRENVLGFDTETKPTFTKGKTSQPALIQLATANTVYLIQLTRLPFRADIAELLASPHALKVGVAINDDMKALARILPFKAVFTRLFFTTLTFRGRFAAFCAPKGEQSKGQNHDQQQEPFFRHTFSSSRFCRCYVASAL